MDALHDSFNPYLPASSTCCAECIRALYSAAQTDWEPSFESPHFRYFSQIATSILGYSLLPREGNVADDEACVRI